MIKSIKISVLSLTIAISSIGVTYSGNSDRAGEAGAFELLINTQPRTMGLFGINSANVRGIDALGTNIAGLAHNRGLSVFANYTSWLSATGTSLVNIGVGSELSPGNNLGFSIGYMSFGDIPLTTTSSPEPFSTFSPYYLNVGLSYARVFGRGVRAGITGKLINEGISNMNATGFSLDAGMQYTTGLKEDFHFGVFVRNLGFPMKFSGDGLVIEKPSGSPSGHDLPYFNRAAKFELPTQFSIAVSKDMFFGKKPESNIYCKPANRVSVSGNFVYNAFTPNNYGIGAEYAYKELVSFRLGYLYEANGLSKEATTRAHMGVAAGFGYDMKLGGKDTKNPSVLEISYNYRPSWVFSGTHNLGFTFYSQKYSYCDEYVIAKKAAPVAEKAKEAVKPIEPEVKAETKTEPKVEIREKIIYKTDTIFRDAPAKIETKVEYKQVNDMLKNFAGNIEFHTATAILTDRGEGALMVVGELMRQYPQSRFRIAGHTDSDGDNDANMRLSKLRAKTVARYISEFKGIPENSLIPEWYGEEKPIADNSTENGKQRNRRVEITVVDARYEAPALSSSTSTSTTKSTTVSTSSKTETPKKVEATKKVVEEIKKVEAPKKVVEEVKKVETPKKVVEEVKKVVESPAKTVEDESSSNEAPKTTQDELNELSTSIGFKPGTDSLTRFAKRSISKITTMMKANPNMKLKVEAHTDNSKAAVSNLELSNQRAKAIADQLKAEGIDASRILTEGFGDTKPIDTNDSEFGRAKNRRIELKVVN